MVHEHNCDISTRLRRKHRTEPNHESEIYPKGRTNELHNPSLPRELSKATEKKIPQLDLNQV